MTGASLSGFDQKCNLRSLFTSGHRVEANIMWVRWSAQETWLVDVDTPRVLKNGRFAFTIIPTDAVKVAAFTPNISPKEVELSKTAWKKGNMSFPNFGACSLINICVLTLPFTFPQYSLMKNAPK
jgi:hypothetical protein